jgi:type VI secretion system protein ImpF
MNKPDAISPTSVLDRLIDLAPDMAADQPASATERTRQMRESLRRDLEDLLNAHRLPATIDPGFEALQTSLLCLGTTGFHGLMLVTSEQRQRLALALKTLIENFEPRLTSVRVSVGPAREADDRVLIIRIAAVLNARHGNDAVVFKTRLDSSTRHFFVAGDHDG